MYLSAGRWVSIKLSDFSTCPRPHPLPNGRINILPNEPDATITQRHIDTAWMLTAAVHHCGVGGGRCTDAGQALGGLVVAVVCGVDHIWAGGVRRHEGATTCSITPPDETSQVAPLTLTDFSNHHCIG